MASDGLSRRPCLHRLRQLSHCLSPLRKRSASRSLRCPHTTPESKPVPYRRTFPTSTSYLLPENAVGLPKIKSQAHKHAHHRKENAPRPLSPRLVLHVPRSLVSTTSLSLLRSRIHLYRRMRSGWSRWGLRRAMCSRGISSISRWRLTVIRMRTSLRNGMVVRPGWRRYLGWCCFVCLVSLGTCRSGGRKLWLSSLL